MIGKVKGKLIGKNFESVTIDVGGLGYVVFVAEKTLAIVSSMEGEEISLFTELLVKEDLLQLVGFLSYKEKEWFNILRSVQGVGSKVSLAILNTLKPEDLLKSVRLKNELSFKSVSGVGPRMAQRIIVELSGRKNILSMSDDQLEVDGLGKDISGENGFILMQEYQKDALSALQNLGFKQSQSQHAIEKVLKETKASEPSEIVKKALQFLAKGNN